MIVTLQSDHPLTDEACNEATGKTFDEWFSEIDALGGPAIGRQGVIDELYGKLKIDMWWIATINNLYEAKRNIVEKDGRGKGFNICVTKTIAAPVERVYSAWADSAQLSRWFGEGTVADVVDGGAYSNADGNAGTFKRVRPNKDLRFTWENPGHLPSMVDVTFTDKGKGKTFLVVNLDRVQNRAEADGLRRGWRDAVDRLKAQLEA